VIGAESIQLTRAEFEEWDEAERLKLPELIAVLSKPVYYFNFKWEIIYFISKIVDYVTGPESMWLTSAEFEERGEAERLNRTS